jgi:Clr5 domain
MLGAFLFREEWENVRDLVHQLYIAEERSLSDVRDILEKSRGIYVA